MPRKTTEERLAAIDAYHKRYYTAHRQLLMERSSQWRLAHGMQPGKRGRPRKVPVAEVPVQN